MSIILFIITYDNKNKQENKQLLRRSNRYRYMNNIIELKNTNCLIDII